LVRHTCDNPICVNPKHLILGNHADNANDAAKRLRMGCQKLNPEAVKVIKWFLKNQNYRGLALKLAHLYKVSPQTIAKIKKGESWAWIKV
jgi:hypothetical protein